MKYALLFLLPLALLLPVAFAEDKCPISGKAAKADISFAVNGKSVSFCCDKCPDAYKKKINLVDAGPKTCPVSKKEATKENSLIVSKHEAIYFCCADCQKSYVEKEKIKIKDDGAKTCPVSGKPAKAAEGTSLLVDGEKVYFCCGNCPKEYLKKLGVARAEPGTCAVCDKKGVAANEMIVTKSEVVYFCCGNCPKGYAAKHFKDGLFVATEEKKSD
jgi:uncharacterized pyridoxamine 5'-phosphate oxidase family protein